MMFYRFGEIPGDKTIIREDYELVDFNVAVKARFT